MASKDKVAERPLLAVSARTDHGTRPARRSRRAGFIPGIVYGKQTTPGAVVVNHRELLKFLHARAGEHGLLTLRLEASGSTVWEKPVLIKSIQQDPVNGAIIHIDFHAIALTERIRIKIPLVLHGEPVGVKQEGGILEHFLRELEVECLPTEIPKEVVHDVSQMKVGDTLHVRDLVAPVGSRMTSDPEGAVASVLTPKEEKAAEVVEAVTEPEVIREKKPEAGEAAAEEQTGKKAEKAEKKDEKKDEK